MSAFLCNPEHIGQIVAHAIGPRGASVHFLKDESKRGVAEVLARANLASIGYRYPDTTAKGDDRIAAAWFSPEGFPTDADYIRACQDDTARYDMLAPVQIIKMCQCLEYQSCEHPGWEESDAKKALDNIMASMIRKLPGYEKAQWEYDRPENAPTVISLSSLVK